jgi:fructose-1,6-bisphosphatase II
MYDIALDPIDGTTNLSKGLPNAISCIAAASRDDEQDNCLQDIPAFYLKKLAYPPAVRHQFMADPMLPININAPLSEVIKVTARILNKEIRDVVVMVLDRPRNNDLVEEIRRVGASLRMIGDGDIAAALAPAMSSSNIDLYAGVGGAPEGVLSAAALRCLGGGMQAQIWPRDEMEKQTLIEQGWEDRLHKVFLSRDLAHGQGLLFCATGISDSPLLKGVQVNGSTAVTHSILMRVKTGTIRFIQAHHNLKTKTLRLRSMRSEVEL